jgi:hypothetical protein
VNVAVNEPDELTVAVCTLAPSNRIVIELPALKPEPVTVTVEPAMPLVGDKVMLATAYTSLDKAAETIPTSRIENKIKETDF